MRLCTLDHRDGYCVASCAAEAATAAFDRAYDAVLNNKAAVKVTPIDDASCAIEGPLRTNRLADDAVSLAARLARLLLLAVHPRPRDAAALCAPARLGLSEGRRHRKGHRRHHGPGLVLRRQAAAAHGARL